MIKGFTTADGVTHLVPKDTPLGVDAALCPGLQPPGGDADETAMLRDVVVDLWRRGQIHQGDAVALLFRLGMTRQDAIAATDAVRAGD